MTQFALFDHKFRVPRKSAQILPMVITNMDLADEMASDEKVTGNQIQN